MPCIISWACALIRVYQDAEVIYTRHYTSTDPRKLPKITNQPNTTVNLLDLGSDDVVFYVGGYPDDFTVSSFHMILY